MSYVIKDYATGAYLAKLNNSDYEKGVTFPAWSWYLCDALKFSSEKEARHFGFVHHFHKAYVISDYKREKASK